MWLAGFLAWTASSFQEWLTSPGTVPHGSDCELLVILETSVA
jgi:hypothetical protein